MTRYFFDTFYEGKVISDDEGMECQDVAAVRAQAAISLLELGREVFPGRDRAELTIKVHDGPNAIYEATLVFEAADGAR
jgi:hypothetical protein